MKKATERARRAAACCVLLLVFALPPVWVFASDYAQVPAWADPPGADPAPAPLNSPGLALGAVASPPHTIRIDDVRIERARADTLALTEKTKRTVAGAHIGIDAADLPAWERIEAADGSWSWRIAVRADGATYLRPHFARAPKGGQVVVYGSDAAETARIAAPTQTAVTDDFWGPPVPGEVLFVEVVGTAETPGSLVDRVACGLRPLDPPAAAEDSCYNDVTCQPDWYVERDAVAHILFESGAYSYECSGTLLNDTAYTGTPWFLTANHCVNSASEADSLVATFFYYTGICDGWPPELWELPSTSGSDIAFSSGTTDVTLLLLDETPPTGTTRAGWTASPFAATGESIAVLHHPGGAYQRITFGAHTGQLGNFWVARYSSGSTEGGSSGAPLFNDQHQVMGQLYRGTASCDFMLGRDDFGKFHLSYQNGLWTFLEQGAPPDDDDSADDDDAADDDSGDDDAGDDDAGDDDGGEGDPGDDDDDGCGL